MRVYIPGLFPVCSNQQLVFFWLSYLKPFYLFFSKSSTIMRPKVPPPLPPKVFVSHSQRFQFWRTLLLGLWKISWSVFTSSPSLSARLNIRLTNNKNKTIANHTARMTAEGEGPSSAVQCQRHRAPPSPPMSPHGPHPRSCRLTAEVA